MMMEELTPPMNPPIPVDPASHGSPSSKHMESRYTCRRAIQPGRASVLGVYVNRILISGGSYPFDAIDHWLVAWTCEKRRQYLICHGFLSQACHYVYVRGM